MKIIWDADKNQKQTMKKIKPSKLDKFEQDIENNAKKFVPVSKKERAKIESILTSATKNKNINIRISENDIAGIRELFSM